MSCLSRFILNSFAIWLTFKEENTDAYLGPCKISMMEHFLEVQKGVLAVNYFPKKYHHRCLIGT